MSDLGLISYRAYWKVRLEVQTMYSGSTGGSGWSGVTILEIFKILKRWIKNMFSKDILLYYLCNYPEKEISVKAISEEMGEFLDHKSF